MNSNPIIISNSDIQKVLDQSLKGKLYRLSRRLFYIFSHPSKVKLLFCLLPSKLMTSQFKIKILNSKFYLDTLWLLETLNKTEDVFTNFYIYLNYKIYHSLYNPIYQNFIISLTMIREIFVKDQYCAQEFLKPDSVILDCGANIGIFSLYASFLSPKGRIYSFEPTKATFGILKKNIISNNLQNNIFVLNTALGDKKGKTKLIVSDNNMGGGNMILDSDFLKGKESNYDKTEFIEMTTIDDFIKENNIQKVDFIKIDTEGYEKQILKGGQKTIKKFHPVIACSAYHLPEDKKEIPKLVLEIEPNYKYRLEKRFEEDLIFWY